MQEQLTSHQIEREVMSRPTEEEKSGTVVQTRAGAWEKS